MDSILLTDDDVQLCGLLTKFWWSTRSCSVTATTSRTELQGVLKDREGCGLGWRTYGDQLSIHQSGV